jgi:hypothetical protein
MKAREIILRPLITEKTTLMQERENTVCFEVNRRANKIEVRNAVEELFVREAGPGFEDDRVLRGHLRRPGWVFEGTSRRRPGGGS